MLCENQVSCLSGMGLGKVKTFHQREVKIRTTVTTRFHHLRAVSAYRGSLRRNPCGRTGICHLSLFEQ
jgi:hypothetical protein